MCETTFTEVNGAAIRYPLSGNGPQTLVLFHELGGSLESWNGLVPLLPENLSVLRADMRGAGMSEKVYGTLDFGLVCDDMAALLNALGITGKVIVAGAAVGGAIGVHFAIRHSNRTARLILICPALGVPPEQHAAALGIADTADEKGMRAIASDVFPNAFPDHLWTNDDERRRARARWLGADPKGYAAAYRTLVSAETRKELADVACPVLALAGKYDPYWTPEMIEAATKIVRHVRFEVVEAGHFMSIQNPDRVAAAIRPFVLET
jgi:pimeloyl-ACP methyl ester carboxylesterase